MRGQVSLGSGTAAAFSGLIAEIMGTRPRALPWLAPALLFAAPEGQRHLTLPRPGPDEVLIHDYQSVSYAAAFVLDTPLDAEARAAGNDHHITLATCGAPIATLTTALRLIKRSDLAAATPATFPARLADSLTWSAPRAITQPQTDQYLALSGDPNPIHRDDTMAATLGLAAPIVPGLLLAALIQPAAEAATPARLTRFTARFMAPLLMNERFRLALQPRGPTRLRACLAAEARALAIADLEFAA